MTPTIEQVLALFEVCHICKQKAHPKTQSCCDECHEKIVNEAYDNCYDNYGSPE